MRAAGTPSRPIKWVRVEPKLVSNRDGGGTFVAVTGQDFTWTGASYRQTRFEFDKLIDRFTIVFTKGGSIEYPHPCSIWGLTTYSDFRAKGPVFSLGVPHKKGVIYIGSGAPSHDCWMKFTDIYGEVAA
jgi:hypothetical protein